MTIEECNKAAAARIPVISDGIIYNRISAVIKKFSTPEQIERGAASFVYLVELEDKNRNSVSITKPERVEKYIQSEV